jgi:glycerophosphoryl diester phosphodiesterase
LQLQEGIDIAKREGFFSIVSYYKVMTRERCAAIRAAGLEAGVWNVDDMDDIRRFIDMGVYRFYTNRPEDALKLKHEMSALKP